MTAITVEGAEQMAREEPLKPCLLHTSLALRPQTAESTTSPLLLGAVSVVDGSRVVVLTKASHN